MEWQFKTHVGVEIRRFWVAKQYLLDQENFLLHLRIFLNQFILNESFKINLKHKKYFKISAERKTQPSKQIMYLIFKYLSVSNRIYLKL